MCDVEKMQQGARVELPSMRDIYKIRSSCFTFQGRFVKLIAPEGFDYTQFAPPRVYGEPGEEIPPGIYTYLFPAQDRIICVPVKNKFELGTIHFVLALLSNARNVIAAGEMLVGRDGTIHFNLLSGSFMQSWMQRSLKGKCDTELRDLTLRMLQQQYPRHRIEYTGAELITETNVPLTAEELNRYVRMGLEVRLYSSKTDCQTEPYAIENAIAIEENTNKRFGSTVESEARIAALRADLERLNSSFELYRPTGGGRKRTNRNLHKRRKTRKV